MQITLRQTNNTLDPELRRLLRAGQDKKGMHEAMGLAIIGITKRAWRDTGLRPSPWPPKADGSAATLRLSGTLAKSVRITAVGARGVTVGSDRPYAAIHQLGGRTKAHLIRPRNKKALFWPGAGHPVASVRHPGSKIPARPFFPFDRRGRPTPKAARDMLAAVRARLRPPGR